MRKGFHIIWYVINTESFQTSGHRYLKIHEREKIFRSIVFIESSRQDLIFNRLITQLS